MIATPSALLFVPDAPSGPSPVVPLVLLALVVLYVLFRGSVVQWVRTNVPSEPEAGEDRPGETE